MLEDSTTKRLLNSLKANPLVRLLCRDNADKNLPSRPRECVSLHT